MNSLILAIICVCVISFAAQSRAELYVYDPFLLPNPLTNPANPALGQYNEWTPPTPGQMEPIGPHVPLNGQNPTPPFGTRPNYFEGPWRTCCGGGVVHPMSISYINTPVMGGSARVAPVPNPIYTGPPTSLCGTDAGALYSNCDGHAARFLAAPYDDAANETVYLSFVANFGTTTDAMGFRAVEFFPADTVPGGDMQRWLDLGYNSFFGYGNPQQQQANTAKLGLASQGEQEILIDAPPSYNQDGRNHLFVFKFEFSNQNNSDNVSVYMDPASSLEPELANAEFRGTNFTLGGFSTVGRFGGDPPSLAVIGELGSTGVFDELRIGTSFFDVLPAGIPDPGDCDGNFVVNLDDYAIIRANFLRTDAAGPPQGDVAKSDGRLGFDGRVDMGDFWLWRRMYEDELSGGGAGPNASIPEPSTVVLALAALLAFTGGLRRPRTIG